MKQNYKKISKKVLTKFVKKHLTFGTIASNIWLE